MNKARLAATFLCSGLTIGISLSGCGSSNNTELPESEFVSITEIDNDFVGVDNPTPYDGSNPVVNYDSSKVYPLFNPAALELPLTNDFLWLSPVTTDGTATVPDTAPPITSALNDLDGFSTTGQINIAFSGNLKADGDGSPLMMSLVDVLNGSVPGTDGIPETPNFALGLTPNIYLLPLNTTDPSIDPSAPISPLTINATNPFDLTALASQSVQAEVISLDGNTSTLRLSPLKPLQPKTKYLVIITNALQAADNSSVGPSITYESLGPDDTGASSKTNLPLGLGDIATLIQSYEALGVGYTAAVAQAAAPLPVPTLSFSDIVLSFSFTTGGTTDVLNSMAAQEGTTTLILQSAIYNAICEATFAADATSLNSCLEKSLTEPTQTSITTAANTQLATALASTGILTNSDFTTPTSRTSAFSPLTAMSATSVNSALKPGYINQGVITLPYYLEIPTDSDSRSYKNSTWSANQTLGAGLDTIAGQEQGTTPPADSDGTYNVTSKYPFAAKTSDVSIPIFVTYPDTDPDAFPGGVGLSKPANGWPVIIFVHPIGADRTASLAIGNTLGAACLDTNLQATTLVGTDDCFAVVSIDLPLHGMVPGHPLGDSLNVDRNGAPINERHFGLTANSLTFEPQPMVYDVSSTTEDESFGSSGSLFLNFVDFNNTRDNMRQAVMDLLNLNASLGSIDLDGDGNGDLDTNRVFLLSMSMAGDIATTFLAVNNNSAIQAANSSLPLIQAAYLNNAGISIAKMLEASPTFGPTLLGALGQLGVVQGTSDFETFWYVFQAALDSVDGVSFAETLANTSTPIVLTELVNDPVVPNQVSTDLPALGAPLAGTEPLASLLNLTQLPSTGGPVSGSPLRSFVKFSKGSHASLAGAGIATPVNPGEPGYEEYIEELSVFGEMVAEIMTFFGSGGTDMVAPNAGSVLSD